MIESTIDMCFCYNFDYSKYLSIDFTDYARAPPCALWNFEALPYHVGPWAFARGSRIHREREPNSLQISLPSPTPPHPVGDPAPSLIPRRTHWQRAPAASSSPTTAARR